MNVLGLYPDVMNIYADRGNLLVLERRCQWRGLDYSFTGVGIGEEFNPDHFDLIYIGGGQDRDQALCADDLVETKKEPIEAALSSGALLLAVCGGYQLLGHSYQLGSEQIPGLGFVDLKTVREDGPRLIGNIGIEVSLDNEIRTLVGFENHGGRTYLGEGVKPLGKVLKGHGNNGRDHGEGIRQENIIGTYMHGPLLPKNVWFADWLVSTATGAQLGSLDDWLEDSAHSCALRATGLAN